ncbi:MAG: hypothetical protein ACI9TH_000435 [Kiritimatiellia bacterium]|jgi:hypothetical protein
MTDTHKDDVNFDVADRDFKYYIFDWDDNILHMPTRIHLERLTEAGNWEPHSVPTSVFALVRNDPAYRPPEGEWENAFRDFRDLAHREESAFLADARAALEPIISGREVGAPSFQRFKTALMEGRLFAIVTARGHYSKTIREGVEYFIEQALSEAERDIMIRNLRGYKEEFEEEHASLSDDEVLSAYLNLNRYHAVTSPEFQQLLGDHKAGPASQEFAKQVAIEDFVRHIIRIVKSKPYLDKPISVGFSDDDPHNVTAVESFIANRLAREFPGIKFVVYDTSDPEQEFGRKIIVTGQLELDFDLDAAD